MVTFGFFIGMAVLTLILIIIVSIATIIGAIALRASKYFESNQKVKNAYWYLVAAAIISTVIAFIMLFLIGYIIFAKPFSEIEITEAFLENRTPTSKDLTLAVFTGKQLKASETGRLVILIVFFLLALMVVILAILCVLAAFQMSEVLQRDQKAVDGANAAFIASFAALFEVGIIIVVAILAYQLKNEATADISKLDLVLEKGTVTNTMNKTPMKQNINTGDISCEEQPGNPFCVPGSTIRNSAM